MNRRQFLTGSSAAALAAALPAVKAVELSRAAYDLASTPDRTARWIFLSTPSGDNNWLRSMFLADQYGQPSPGWVSFKPDFSDLGEPYLSAVREHLRLEAELDG